MEGLIDLPVRGTFDTCKNSNFETVRRAHRHEQSRWANPEPQSPNVQKKRFKIRYTMEIWVQDIILLK
jgi:hypothetical protein